MQSQLMAAGQNLTRQLGSATDLDPEEKEGRRRLDALKLVEDMGRRIEARSIVECEHGSFPGDTLNPGQPAPAAVSPRMPAREPLAQRAWEKAGNPVL